MPEEQTETQQTEQTQSDVASRDELIEAVRQAGGTASVDVEAEAQKAAETAAVAGAAVEAPSAPEDPEAKFQAILDKRRENHEKLRDAGSRADRILREAEETKQRLIEEARAEARKAAEEEREKLRLNFRERPTETLRQFGTPDEITDAVMREGTPEARALAKAQEEARLAREEAKKGSTALQELEKFKKDLAQREYTEKVSRVRDEFLSKHAAESVTPALYAQHRTPDAVFLALDAQCREWEKDGLERGVHFDDATLVKYVENESRKWLAQKGFTLAPVPANQVQAGAPSVGPGLATKVTANAPRTLSAAAGSERRTSPRPLHEMAPDEQRKALIEEVAAARKANPDATS